jgi:glycine cleavage system aminomethyltransferase T
MSTLDFLSVSAAVDANGLHPVARSSMDRRQRDAGASFEERDGWLVPVSIPGEDDRVAIAGVADLSHLSITEVRPSEPVLRGEGVVWYRLSDRRSLVISDAAGASALRAEAGERTVLDLSGALSIIALCGEEAETVVRRLTHLHHFPSSGEVAHVNAHVLKPEPGDAYWIVFAQEFGHYLWDVVVDRAAALGGGPIGVDALPKGALA